MKRLFKLIFLAVTGEILSFILIVLIYPQNHSQTTITKIISPLAKSQSTKILGAKLESQEDPGRTSFARITQETTAKTNFSILLLGLDARIGDLRPRCDSIHLIYYDANQSLLKIITIPRGTLVSLDSANKQISILANICHTKGVNYVVEVVSNLTGIKPDFVVKIGFSQAMGLLRFVNLAPVETFQYLRNRKYPFGDHQRSHNQAIFLKDLIVSRLEQISKLPNPLKYVIFKMVDTDMDFEGALQLLDQLVKSKIDKDPNRIIITSLPAYSYKFADLHVENQQVLSAQIEKENGREYKDFQLNTTNYLTSLVDTASKYYFQTNSAQAFQIIKTPFSQKLWLQIEDENTRHKLHFDLLKIYVLTNPDKNNLSSLVLDFITEMEELGNNQYLEQANELLNSLGI